MNSIILDTKIAARRNRDAIDRNLVNPIILDAKIIDRNLAKTIETIRYLAYREDVELLPTAYARAMAIALIIQTSESHPHYFFTPWISGDEFRGVRAVWSRPLLNREVRLIVPPNPTTKIRIYHEVGQKAGLDFDVSGQILGEYIKSLCQQKHKH